MQFAASKVSGNFFFFLKKNFFESEHSGCLNGGPHLTTASTQLKFKKINSNKLNMFIYFYIILTISAPSFNS